MQNMNPKCLAAALKRAHKVYVNVNCVASNAYSSHADDARYFRVSKSAVRVALYDNDFTMAFEQAGNLYIG